MRCSALITLLSAACASAFPFLAREGSLRRNKSPGGIRSLGQKRAAEPYSPEYTYTGATIDGLPGTGVGGVQVPAPGDTAHEYQDPPFGAYRGPCPGLNAAANHGFLSRDGITTFDELVAAQQNVYNAGYDLAVFLATLGTALDGDLVTEKLSIGGDATNETSSDGGLLGDEGGLDTHNKFESDTSLTRSDYYIANGDDYSFNGTLFSMMTQTVSSTSSTAAPLYDFNGLALYRSHRYEQSVAENPNFYFPPKVLHLYGAASFLYELFPSSSNANTPDVATISTFFGAVPSSSAAGGYAYQPERIPENWTNRETPYTLLDIGTQILEMYLAYPKPFGGNVGAGDFVPLTSFGEIENGAWTPQTAEDVVCLLYQAATENVPGSISMPVEAITYIATKLNPVFDGFGCTLISLDGS